MDYQSRRRAAELGLSESELVVAKAELDDLRDGIFVLEAAIEDVERDLRSSSTKQEYVEALEWLLDAAKPLVS